MHSKWSSFITADGKMSKFQVRTRAMSLPKYTNSKEDIVMYGSRLLKAELPLSLRLMGMEKCLRVFFMDTTLITHSCAL